MDARESSRRERTSMRHAAVPPTLGAARPAVQRFVHDSDWSHVEAVTTRSREGVSPALGAGDKVQRLVALRAFLLVQVWIAPGLLPEDLGDRVRRTREVGVGAFGVWHAVDLDLDRPTIPFAPDARPSVIHAQAFSFEGAHRRSRCVSAPWRLFRSTPV
jgi:hypothetical protein